MTSHELAKKLLELPDYPVTVSGYEGGVNIVDNVHDEWYYGKHEYKREGGLYDSEEVKDKEIIQAIHIGSFGEIKL